MYPGVVTKAVPATVQLRKTQKIKNIRQIGKGKKTILRLRLGVFKHLLVITYIYVCLVKNSCFYKFQTTFISKISQILIWKAL